jgi:retron-type reverse transcriptase
VDGQALEEFEADLADNLYKIWNRMSSGSYFPPPVRAVEIPKPHSPGTRVPGLYPLLRRVNIYLTRWAGKKYRRLRTHKRFKRWWTGRLEREPGLFAQWQWVHSP